MPLSLMYITNRPDVASVAQAAGVDRLFVDMEYIGKETRQAGMNTVKSHHTYADVEAMHRITSGGSSELLVRVNPIHDAGHTDTSSEEEIETVIACGADVIMLPMFRTRHEVDRFLSIVNGRAKTMLLLETREACEGIDGILSGGGFDELHIGLNDLHLAYRRRFMFELLADGTVERLAVRLKERGIPFGFGGIARIGYGTLPAEYIIAEHYRLGSRAAILSRSFCNAETISDPDELAHIFRRGVESIRACEAQAAALTAEEFENNRQTVLHAVEHIVQGLS